MMFLAQTTQPASPWTPESVILVATVIITLVASTLIPALIALKKAGKAEERATAAVASAAENTGAVAVLKDVVKGHSETNERQQAVLDTMQQTSPPQNP